MSQLTRFVPKLWLHMKYTQMTCWFCDDGVVGLLYCDCYIG